MRSSSGTPHVLSPLQVWATKPSLISLDLDFSSMSVGGQTQGSSLTSHLSRMQMLSSLSSTSREKCSPLRHDRPRSRECLAPSSLRQEPRANRQQKAGKGREKQKEANLYPTKEPEQNLRLCLQQWREKAHRRLFNSGTFAALSSPSGAAWYLHQE